MKRQKGGGPWKDLSGRRILEVIFQHDGGKGDAEEPRGGSPVTKSRGKNKKR